MLEINQSTSGRFRPFICVTILDQKRQKLIPLLQSPDLVQLTLPIMM